MSKYNTYHARFQSPEERFWSRVDKSAGPDGCWLWMGNRAPFGYGQFWFNGANGSAHRAVLIFDGRELAPEDVVCHTCDNPPCVNPRHLFVGTHTDNARDRTAKGRGNPPIGERAHMCKLRPAEVKAIKEFVSLGLGDTAIARRYGVSRSAVALIRKGRNWKHVS